MAGQVWIDPPSNPPFDLVEKIQEQLSQAGIEIVNNSKGVGLILFSRIDEELSLRLTQKSQGGERRVIAVCLDREGIPPPTCLVAASCRRLGLLFLVPRK